MANILLDRTDDVPIIRRARTIGPRSYQTTVDFLFGGAGFLGFGRNADRE